MNAKSKQVPIISPSPAALRKMRSDCRKQLSHEMKNPGGRLCGLRVDPDVPLNTLWLLLDALDKLDKKKNSTYFGIYLAAVERFPRKETSRGQMEGC
jgi:hypothetical protein